ncbi:MAG: geranylgeranylglyceryl/heptaprenylglyceryl phosphate synthase [Candidatus Bathyarchaeia archaeon]
MRGRVEKYLNDAVEREGTIHLSLIDPQNVKPDAAGVLARNLSDIGSSAIMIGGSTVVSQLDLDEVVKEIKNNTDIPTILFPNGVAGISKHADAIFFSTLMNSSNPYFITGVQALGAPLVRRYGLETLPMGYIVVGSSPGTVGFVGQAAPIPQDKPELAAMYALASEYLGMRFVYLEAGSGSERPVSPEMIRYVRDTVGARLIVGGGIRTPQQAIEISKAGADVIVTGNMIEKSSIENARRLIAGLRRHRE